MFKEGNDVFEDRREVIHLEEPDTIAFIANRTAPKTMLEKCQDRAILLGHVQAQRHLPRQFVVWPYAKAYVEASLAIHESGKVKTDRVRNMLNRQHLTTLAFPADCLHRTDCHCPRARVSTAGS